MNPGKAPPPFLAKSDPISFSCLVDVKPVSGGGDEFLFAIQPRSLGERTLSAPECRGLT